MSDVDEARERTNANLQAVYEHLRRPTAQPAVVAAPSPDGSTPTSSGARWGSLGVLAALIAGKLKLLAPLASVLKLQTLGTMVLSIGFYAAEWGLSFAIGFVLLIFVHELGHALMMKREGIAASAPVFIPFVGAVIAMKDRPRDAYVEAKVGIGGPLLGSVGAWIVLAAGLVTHIPLLIALGHVGIMLNLFNLIPVSPLDGGRVVGAFTWPFWLVGYGIGVVAVIVTESPMLMLMMALGLFTLVDRWRKPVPGYHAITRPQRLGMAGLYLGLMLALVATYPLGQEKVRHIGTQQSTALRELLRPSLSAAWASLHIPT